MKDVLAGAVQSKTIWVSALVAGLGFIVADGEVLKMIMSQQTYGYTMVIIGALMAALRVVTSDSLADKAPVPAATEVKQ